MATASYLVGSVGPEPVCPCRDAGSGELVCEEEEDPGGEEGGVIGPKATRNSGRKTRETDFMKLLCSRELLMPG